MSKCQACHKVKPIQCRNMCYQCYKSWLIADRPEMPFETRTSTEQFDDACKSGEVRERLDRGEPQYSIARSFGVTDMTARRYMQKNGVIPVRHRRHAKATVISYSKERMIALAMPWVSNSDRATYYG